MSQPFESSVTPNERPSRARWVLILWLCGLSAILYLDRICMSQALGRIQEEFKLSNTELAYIGMAFTLAYGLFEIPTGSLADRYGSRFILVRIVIWWSAFTALTGVCTGFYSLIMVRFLFGAGEAGAFPNTARVISRWYPAQERGRVQGFMLAAAQVGAVAAPTAAAFLIKLIGWRWTFSVFGLIGIVWAIGFGRWFRDNPAKHPEVNSQELDLINAGRVDTHEESHQSVPWKAVFTNRGILTLGSIIILAAFYTYFFYTWLPKYLTNIREIDDLISGPFASVVLAGSALGMLVGGWISDRLAHLPSDQAAVWRPRLGFLCFLSAAICLSLGTRCENPYALVGLWSASFFAVHIMQPLWWTVVMPQCGKHVGAISGLLNGIGVVGALISQWYVGFFTDLRKEWGYTGRDQWDPLIDIYSVVLIVGGLAWLSYRFQPLQTDKDSQQSTPSQP